MPPWASVASRAICEYRSQTWLFAMAAVRVARFNQKKPLVVTFGGAYHGWWDGMQPYVGNDRTVAYIYG